MAKEPGPRQNFNSLITRINWPTGVDWVLLYFDPVFGQLNKPEIRFVSLDKEPRWDVDQTDFTDFEELVNETRITKEMLKNEIVFKTVDDVTGEIGTKKFTAFGIKNIGDPHYPAGPDFLGSSGIAFSFFFKVPKQTEFRVRVTQDAQSASYNPNLYSQDTAGQLYKKGVFKVGARITSVDDKQYPVDKIANVSHLVATYTIDPKKKKITVE